MIFNIIISTFFSLSFILLKNNFLLSTLFLYVLSLILFFKIFLNSKDLKKSILLFVIITSFFGSYLRVYNKTYLPLYRVFLVILIVLLSFSIFRKLIDKKSKNNFHNRVNVLSSFLNINIGFLLLFVIYGLVSIIRLKEFTYWNYQYITFLLQGFLITLLIIFLFNIDDLKIFFSDYIYIVVFTIIIVSLIEIIFKIHLSNRINEITPYIPAAFYYNQNNLDLILVLLFPSFYIFNERELYLKIVINLFITNLVLFIVVISGSRISLVGLMFFLILTLFFKNYRKKTIGLVVSFSILFFSFSIIYSKSYVILSFIMSKVSFLQKAGLKESSAYIRLNLYNLGLKEMIHNPLGNGPGGAEYFYSHFKEQLTGIINPHSLWIEIGVNFGLVGFILFSIFYFGLLFSLIKRRFFSKILLSDHDIYLYDSLIFSLILYVIVSFNAASNIYPVILPWILYGFALNLITKGNSTTE